MKNFRLLRVAQSELSGGKSTFGRFFRTMLARILAARWNFSSLAKGHGGIVVKYRDRKLAETFRRRDPKAVRIVDDGSILIVGRDPVELMQDR